VLSADDRANFDTLSRAFRHGRVVLMEVQRIADGAIVSALSAVGCKDGFYTFTPSATLVEGNPSSCSIRRTPMAASLEAPALRVSSLSGH